MSHQHVRSKNGFTLIEIMVTITIIGLLAGLSFSGAAIVMGKAKSASAKNTALNVRTAISACHTDYRRLPVTGSAGNEFIDLKSNEAIMDILLGAKTKIGIERNPRSQSYFSGGGTARRLDSDRFINGIHRAKDESGTLWDPFGRLYGIRLDVGNRGSVPNPAISPPNLGGGSESPHWGQTNNNADTPDILSDSVIIWSSGKDAGIASDNITTW